MDDLLNRLHVAGDIGLDLSPGDPLAAEAESAIRSLLLKLEALQKERDEFAEELDDRSDYELCDCCLNLSTDTTDVDGEGDPLGHVQCSQCTRLAAVEEERDNARALYRQEYDIVARIWAQFGNPSYEELAGRTIYDLVAAAQEDAKTFRRLYAEEGHKSMVLLEELSRLTSIVRACNQITLEALDRMPTIDGGRYQMLRIRAALDGYPAEHQPLDQFDDCLCERCRPPR